MTSKLSSLTENKEDEKKEPVLSKPDFRVAVVGNVDSGKSTLIGVLVSGKPDDGRGLARKQIMLHHHEASTGRTSAIGQHIVGFRDDKSMVHNLVAASANAAQKTKGWREVVSQSSSILTFVDLAGHEKYLKTTMAGLTGSQPDYAIVVIGGNMGIKKMTKEHLGILLALRIPFTVVITKVDIAPANVLSHTKKTLTRILRSSKVKKQPFEVRTEKDVATVAQNRSAKMCPIFLVSTVKGTGVDLFKSFLAELSKQGKKVDTPKKATVTATTETPSSSSAATNAAEPVEFCIEESFVVTGVGLVVSGAVTRGTLHEATQLSLGPCADGAFHKVIIKSLHCKRVPVESVRAGSNCAVALRSASRKFTLRRSDIRRAMVLVDAATPPMATMKFAAQVKILHHPSTISKRYQAVIHCGMVRQTAGIRAMSKDRLRTGDQALVVFEFIQRAEYLHAGSVFLFREGGTKGLGKIVRLMKDDEKPEDALAQHTRTVEIKSSS